MTRDFKFTVNTDAATLLSRVKELARTGVTFTGDEHGGEFTYKTPVGIVSGAYAIKGKELTISIRHVPMLLHWSTIGAELVKLVDKLENPDDNVLSTSEQRDSEAED